MHTCFRLLTALAVASFTLTPMPASAAPNLEGTWEVQSMGGDRTIHIKQRGKKVVAHRVMWPEFQGEKYKLEHLYRGKLKGDELKGQLLVREEELPDYEVLRPFVGSIESEERIILDGLPMKRITNSAPPPPAAKPKERGSQPPGHGAAPPPPPPTPPKQVVTKDPADGSDDAPGLFDRIMGSPGMDDLFQISNTVAVPNEVAQIEKEADTLYRRKRYEKALSKYRAAAAKGASVRLLHRMGRCQLFLEKYADARATLQRALRLDPGNAQVKRDYRRAMDG